MAGSCYFHKFILWLITTKTGFSRFTLADIHGQIKLLDWSIKFIVFCLHQENFNSERLVSVQNSEKWSYETMQLQTVWLKLSWKSWINENKTKNLTLYISRICLYLIYRENLTQTIAELILSDCSALLQSYALRLRWWTTLGNKLSFEGNQILNIHVHGSTSAPSYLKLITL